MGHIICFWLWALDNAPQGDLTGISPRMIARAAQWEGDPEQFMNALLHAGFVEKTDKGYVIHDWYDYAGKLIERKAADRERKRRQASRKSQEAQKNSAGMPSDVPHDSNANAAEFQRNSDGNPHVSNSTIPDRKSGGDTLAREEDYIPGAKTNEPLDNDLAAVVHEFESCGYGTIHERVLEHLAELVDTYGREWVVNALREGMRQNKRTLAYVDGILKRWQSRGGMTLGPSESPEHKKRGKHGRDQPGSSSRDAADDYAFWNNLSL